MDCNSGDGKSQNVFLLFCCCCCCCCCCYCCLSFFFLETVLRKLSFLFFTTFTYECFLYKTNHSTITNKIAVICDSLLLEPHPRELLLNPLMQCNSFVALFDRWCDKTPDCCSANQILARLQQVCCLSNNAGRFTCCKVYLKAACTLVVIYSPTESIHHKTRSYFTNCNF